jgi:hypothetical protein
LGVVQRWAGGHVCVHGTAGPGEGVVTGRRTLRREGITLRREGMMSEAAFVLVADRVARLGPMPDPQAKAAVEAGISGDDS